MRKLKKPRKTVNRNSRLTLNAHTLRAAVAWAIHKPHFSSLPLHGNTTWRITELVALAMMWVWSDHRTLTGAFGDAHRWSLALFGHSILGTFQGLMNALTTWTSPVLPRIRSQFQRLMEQHGGEHYRFRGWLPIAVDGSRLSTPRTRQNEEAFCAPNYGHSARSKLRRRRRAQSKRKRYRRRSETRAAQRPQVWTTLLWHMGLKMPWSWRTGRTDSSERAHFQDVLATEEFPKNTLFCCDAGFVGYELWRDVMNHGHHILIRIGANVRLLEDLGYHRRQTPEIVYLWPEAKAKAHQPPLILRRISVRIGKADIELVTSVLNVKTLTARHARSLYQMRWGVELQFRALKQTFARRTLRSRTPGRALVELDWSLLGLWLIQLFAVRRQLELGHLPEQCSVGLAINVIREMFQRSLERSQRGADLRDRLGEAVKDRYERLRPKRSRQKSEVSSKPSCGKPTIRKATREEKRRLRRYLKRKAA